MEMTYEKFIKKWTPYNYLVTWMCLMIFVCTSVNLICSCSAWNYVCAYTHKCLSPVFQCYDDKIWLVTQHFLNKNMLKKNKKIGAALSFFLLIFPALVGIYHITATSLPILGCHMKVHIMKSIQNFHLKPKK